MPDYLVAVRVPLFIEADDPDAAEAKALALLESIGVDVGFAPLNFEVEEEGGE